jgi:HPt (histidine-containing phosphotransfer) domain-containing protein
VSSEAEEARPEEDRKMISAKRQPRKSSPFLCLITLPCDGDNEEARDELLSCFDQHFRRGLAEIRRAISEEDGNRLRRAGHALKDAAAGLGLDNIRDAGISIEKAGKEYRLHDAAWILVRLQEDFTRFQELRRGLGFGEKESV